MRYSALVQLQLALDRFQVLAVAQVLLVVDMVVALFPVADTLVAPVLLLATNAADQTISLAIVCSTESFVGDSVLMICM
jgi:hypothetical protein